MARVMFAHVGWPSSCPSSTRTRAPSSRRTRAARASRASSGNRPRGVATAPTKTRAADVSRRPKRRARSYAHEHRSARAVLAEGVDDANRVARRVQRSRGPEVGRSQAPEIAKRVRHDAQRVRPRARRVVAAGLVPGRRRGEARPRRRGGDVPVARRGEARLERARHGVRPNAPSLRASVVSAARASRRAAARPRGLIRARAEPRGGRVARKITSPPPRISPLGSRLSL